MSEGQPSEPDVSKTAENPPEQAVFRPSKWPGLIWAVPVAALAIIAWLGISALLQNGPNVDVMFPVAGGLKPGTTKVEYKGYIVGHVGSVTLSKKLDQMRVEINFDADMKGHLGTGTRYWLIGTSFSFSQLSNVMDMITGPVIGLDPRPGKTVRKAQGLGAPPQLTSAQAGLKLTLWAPHLSNLTTGSPILYRGYKVGMVTGVAMASDGSFFSLHAFIDSPWQKLVTGNSRFWNAGAVRISSGGAGAGVQLQSVPALLMGAVGFETPAGMPAPRAQDGNRFRLYNSESQAGDAAGPAAVTYRAIFSGGPHGLQAGAPVQLDGSPAGTVTSVTMRYNAAKGALETLTTFTLQPQEIPLATGRWNLDDPAPQMNAMLSTLIAKGLRAEMGSTVPVVGGKMIQLAMVKDAPQAKLQPGNPAQVPVFGGGSGDVGQILAQINDILASVNAMPLDQIAANIHSATSRLAALTRAPQTKQTLRHLDHTMAHVDAITRQVNTKLPAILQGVQQSAAQAQAALTAAQGLLNTRGPSNAAPDEADLPHTLYELSQAAQSLRALADFLNSHPGALITGRSD